MTPLRLPLLMFLPTSKRRRISFVAASVASTANDVSTKWVTMTAPSSNWVLKTESSRKSNFLPLILGIGIVFLLVIEGGLQCYRSLQINQLNIEITQLQQRLTVLEDEKNLHRVVKRQATNLYEDDVPIRQGRYKDQSEEQQGDSEGMRVYDAWFQHKNARHIPKSRVGGANRRKASDYGNAIKPYHR